MTKCDLGSQPSDDEEQSCTPKNFLTSVSSCNISPCFQIQDLYDHFEVKLNDFEVRFLSDNTLYLFFFFSFFWFSYTFGGSNK